MQGVNNTISEYDLIQKYGARYNRIKTDAIIEKMDVLKKEKIKDPKTENILSYANSIHGEKPTLKHTDEKAVSELWNQIKSDPSYTKLNYAEKRKLIDKKTSEFISSLDIQTPEGKEPPDKVDLKNRILGNLLPKFAQDENGQPSIEGIKLYLEDQLDEVQTMLSYHQKSLIEAGMNPENMALTDEKDQNQFKILKANHGDKNVDTWYFDTQQQIMRLKQTERELDRLLKMPEYQGGFRDIGKALRTTDAKALASLGVKDMANALQISHIAKKIENGESLDYAEKKQIETFATLNFIQSLDIEGTGFKVSKGIINMVPYIAQFALSGGAYTGVKGAVLEATKGAAKKSIKIGAKRYTMADLGARALGSVAQTTVVPQMYIKNIADYARNNVTLVTDPELNKLTAEVQPDTGLGIGKAIARGYWDAYSEMFTERMGTHIMGSLGKAGKTLGKIKGTQMLKNTALVGFMEAKGIKTVADLATRMKKAGGWDGMMEEYMEEVVNYYMAGLADPKNLKGPGSKEWRQDQLVTFLTVAGFSGLVMKPIDITLKQTIGKNMSFTGTKEDGTPFKEKIPTRLVKSLSDIFDKYPGFIGAEGSKEIDQIFNEWDGKLTKTQWDFTMSYVLKLGQEKVNQEIVEKTTDKSFLEQINEKADVVQPSSKISQDNLLKLNPEERKEIEEENKRVTALHPELAKNNLLVEDRTTGQKIEPDKQSTKKLLDQVTKLISEKAERDEMGNMTNVTPELQQLLRQQEILEDTYLSFVDRNVPFKELSVSEKNELLQGDLKAEKDLKGTISRVTNRKFGIKLDDGRTVYGYYDTRLTKDDLALVDKAILGNETVTLKLDPWDNWNPDLKIVDKNGIPYYNQIQVMVNGKPIGAIEITDYKEEKVQKVKQDDLTKKLDSIESRRNDELKAKFGRDLDVIKSGSTYVISRLPISNFDEENAKQLQDDYKAINAKYDAEVEALKGKKLTSNIKNGKITFTLSATETYFEEEIFVMKDGQIISGRRKTDFLGEYRDRRTNDAITDPQARFDELIKKIDPKNIEIESTDIAPKALKEREEEALEKLKAAASKALLEAAKKTGGVKEFYSDEEKDALLKAVLSTIKALGDYTTIQVEKLIEFLKKAIANTAGISQEEKNAYYSIIDANEKTITDYYTKLRLKQEGLSKKAPKLSLDDLVFPEQEGVVTSGAQKVDSFLNGYAPVWRGIANAIDSSKDNVEKKFLEIAKTKQFEATVSNDVQYQHYVNELRGKDLITDSIAEMLSKSSYESAVSLFNFYSNVVILRQFGFLPAKKAAAMKLLNPPQRFDEFVDSFNSTVRRYDFNGYSGPDAVKEGVFRRITAHKEERDRRFNTSGNRSYTWFEAQTPEKRAELRKEQHQSDIALLSELTGISMDIWSEYFTEQTKETFANMTPGAESRTNFRTYDNLLSKDTYRGTYHRIQSDIAFNLTYLVSKFPSTGSEEFENAFYDFFTKGNEETGVLSNLYKLSTASRTNDDIALSGVDIKGDRFSSISQDNMVFEIGSRIRTLPIGNDLTGFYYDLEQDADFTILNGIHNTDANPDKKGTADSAMSFEDLWLAQMYEFLQEGDSYRAWMGQFGDKTNLIFIKAPKFKLPENDSAEMKEFLQDNPDFEKSVDWVMRNFINYNQSFFNFFLPSPQSGLSDREKIEAKKTGRLNMARAFVYNFSKNMKDIMEIFDGSLESYDNDFTKVVKRRSSSISPGQHFNTNIEGGLGETYQFALVNDKVGDFELFDGHQFMSGDIASRAQISMGTTLSRSTEEGMEILSSMKVLGTSINPNGNLRDLDKGNIINIDLFAEIFPDSKFADIQKFMKANKIDMLSFQSTTKVSGQARGKKQKAALAINLWDDQGNVIKNPVIPENSIVQKNTSDLYIQQDLRHPNIPKKAKMSSQLLANVLSLPKGKVIGLLLNQLQNMTINKMTEEFKNGTLEEKKIEWLLENVNENTQADLFRMLEMGLTPYEPAMANYMRKIIASNVTKKGLEVPINRVTTQEVTDPSSLLKGFIPSSDGYHMLVPEIASDVQGARYPEYDFVGKKHKNAEGEMVYDAIDHVRMNHDKYRDLFDMNDNLREWEIIDRDGEIPGELIISVRTPNSNFHTMTVGRLKHKLVGNFTMLDKDSQSRSGSDFDGDQRFNWVFFKDKHGKFPLFATKEGLANQMLMSIAEEYMIASNNEKIIEPINTKAFDDIVDELRIDQDKYGFYDPRAWDRAREENLTGVRLKALLTDFNTVYSLINDKKINFKKQVVLTIETTEQQQLSVNDRERLGMLEQQMDPEKENADEIAAIKQAQDRIPKIGDVVTMTFQEELNDVRVKILEIKKKSDTDYLVRVQNMKNEKEYSYHVNHAGEGELVYFEKHGFGLPPGVDEAYIRSLYVPKSVKTTVPVRKQIMLSGINKDTDGIIKTALVNFLNMSFDNASDPKVEIMGLNEHTAAMYFIALFGDKSVDVTDREAVHNHVRNVSKYFTSQLVRDFTTEMRRNTGGYRKSDINDVKEALIGNGHNPSDVEKLLTFFQNGKELSEIRRFYSLTQKAPDTVVEFQAAKQLYRKVRTNDFKFIDVKNLFGYNCKPIQEFAITETMLALAESIIYSDSFEYSTAGREIYKAIHNELKAKNDRLKYLTKDQLKSIAYGMNTIAAVKAIGNRQSFKSLYNDLIAQLKPLKEKYPNNDFLQAITKVVRKGYSYIEINPDYQRGAIPDMKLEQMRNSFDILWKEDPELANKFVTYAFLRWGPTTSTWKGSFYNIVGDNYKVWLSEKMSDELDKWNGNELTKQEKLQIMEWILRNSGQGNLKEISTVNPEYSSYYDYNAIATVNYSISENDLRWITQATTEAEYLAYAERFGFDPGALVNFVEQKTGNRKIKGWAKSVIEHFDTKANRLFPTDVSSGNTVKDMMPNTAVGEILAIEDEPLNKFVMDQLRKMYPGVQIFTDHQAFVDFVMKFGDRGFNVDPSALGHAFANAIYIDPTRAVQSTMFHEHAHIYWDALPNENKTKNALRELFKQQYTFGTIDDIDEQIMLEIGRAGVDIANVKLNGNLLDKFVQLLKQFWIDVKTVLGIANRSDLTNRLAWRIWYNSDKIKPNTNYGESLVRNMVSFDNKADRVSFLGDSHTHMIGETPIPSVTTVILGAQEEKFDPDAKSKAMIGSFSDKYRGITREKLSQQHIEDMITREMNLWRDTAEKGTIMHAVMESVFGERIITKEERDQFEDVNVYYDLVAQADELKRHYEQLYPGITWHTEPHLISKKYKIGGFADLVGDLGDNKLILFDFKTTDYEYADSEMAPTDKYKKAYALFKPPFQTLPQSKYNIHMLQTNMYANMLEEQEDPNQPGKTNQVVAIRIVPIIRELTQNKKIKAARLANNNVKIPRNDKTTSLAELMMSQNYALREDFSKVYPEMRENLEKSGMAPHLVTSTLVAYNFFKQVIPDLANITREELESLRGTEFSALKTRLFSLGFTTKDLYGAKAIPFEFLFFNAVSEGLNLTKEEFLKNIDTYFPEQEVSAKYNAIPNPDATERRWSHVFEDGRDMYLHEVGYETIKEGDQIVMIYDIKRPTGETPRDFYYYTVESINKKRKNITAKNQATGEIKIIPIPGERSGAYRIYDSMPLTDSTGKPIEPVAKDSFVPRYLYEKESIVERHINFDKIAGEKSELMPTEAAEAKRKRDIKFMWSFFNTISTLAEAEVWANSSDNVDNLYHLLRSVDDRLSGSLTTFVREISTNHLFANAIARENRLPGVPTQPLPVTLNTYLMLTGHQDTIWRDWNNMAGLRYAMPQGLVEGSYVPLSLFTTLTEYGNRTYQEELYLLNRKMEKYNDKVDFELAMFITDNGDRFWRTPGEKALDSDPLTNEFLETIYEYYEKLDPNIALDKQNGIRQRIPVANVFLTRPEAIAKWGKKWGPMLYMRLKPQAYDNVKLTIMVYDKKGDLVPFKDALGKEVVKSLADIKQDFALENMDESQLREYLGPKWKHIMLRIPGTITVAGQSGLLNHYIKTAKEIYAGKRDANNVGTTLKQNKRNIAVIGHGKSAYSTENLVAAEKKAIDSMLFRYNMKHLMAPLDWMLYMYQKDTKDEKHITDYLRSWGEYILYGVKPKESFLGGETISDLIDVGNKANSYNKIMFGVSSQVMNFAIGQGFDIVREPEAYKKGISRLFSKDKNGNPGFLKAWNMAKRLGLANIVDDAVFDQIEKEYNVMGLDLKKVENVGYKLMEYAEKGNQFPIFVGLMTDQEWEAYDGKANVINDQNQLTEYRKSLITSRVQSIHGHYSTISMAPWFITNLGKLGMAFRKWFTAYVWSQIAPYHIDKNLIVRSGVIPALHLFGKRWRYNRKSVQERQDYLADIINKKKSTDSDFFSSTEEYMNTLIEQVNGNKITYADLSESDRKNLFFALGQVSMLVVSNLIMMALIGG